MNKKVVMLLSALSLISSFAWAGLQGSSCNAVNDNSGQSNLATDMGIGFGIAAAAYGSQENWPMAALYGGGGYMAGTVVGNIMDQKNSNTGGYNAVTVGSGACPPNDPTNPTNLTNPTNPGGPTGPQNPLWGKYLTTMDDLKKKGITFDPKKGTVTTPGGTFTVGDMSPAALKAGGFSNKDIAAFNKGAAEIKAKAAAAAKGADSNSDLFGDSVGGSGSSSGANAGMAIPAGIPTGPRSAVDRNPAQVAGMSRSLNGEPIGVSADDMWKMMNRRYNLQEKNGFFLAP